MCSWNSLHTAYGRPCGQKEHCPPNIRYPCSWLLLLVTEVQTTRLVATVAALLLLLLLGRFSRVQLCATLSVDCSPPGSSVHGILQARIPEWVASSFSRDLLNPGIKPRSPALQAGSFPSEARFIFEELHRSLLDWINTIKKRINTSSEHTRL